MQLREGGVQGREGCVRAACSGVAAVLLQCCCDMETAWRLRSWELCEGCVRAGCCYHCYVGRCGDCMEASFLGTLLGLCESGLLLCGSCVRAVWRLCEGSVRMASE